MQLDISTLTGKWLTKADKDLMVALLAFPQGDLLKDEIGFHCQQSAEKNLKAFIVYQNRMPARTHNLKELINEIVRIKPEATGLMEGGLLLNEFAVTLRYPLSDEQADLTEIRELIEIANKFRTTIRSWIPGFESDSRVIQLLRQYRFELE